ncbi:cytidine deaminase-like [Pollicipes pollicipes]|nr:cytidine deaminase-like [Pollicipes pollicipes]
MDSELRQLGFTGFTARQLTSFLARLRRQTRDESVLEEYSELSVWSSGGRNSPDGAASPPPKRPAIRIVAKSPPEPAEPPTMDEAAIAQLVASSLEAREQAYCAYSQFAVGAALLCADGHVVTGCNVENASYGLTNCAERTAVFRAVAEGRRRFSAVAIAAEMGDVFVGPCGACRQVLAEFNPEMPVILAKPDGQTKRTSMKELLPMPFLPKDVPFKK